MKSYDIVEWGRPLQEVLRETPEPIGTEVRVKIEACGVCHSDLHIQQGSLDMGEGRKFTFESAGVRLPFTLGHEIVGTVDKAGPQSQARVGTRCVVYPWQGCGTCRHCVAGDELACEAAQALGTRRPGGYSDYVMVSHERYLLDYGKLDPYQAATCACSGLTAYSALRKLPPMGAADAVLIIGAGGLGLAALDLAKVLSSARIVVADIDEKRLAFARAAGAHETIDTSAPRPHAALRASIGEGVRGVIDFVGSPATVEFALKAVGKGGTIIVVGLFGGSMSLSTALLPSRNVTLRGSYVGTLAEMQELLHLAGERPVLTVPLEARPMSEINTALADLAAGQVSGRLIALAGQ